MNKTKFKKKLPSKNIQSTEKPAKLVSWVELILSSLLSQGFVEEVCFKSRMEEVKNTAQNTEEYNTAYF